eukprot:15382-Eustigmatos_ZCMA.PRE.1
MEKGALLQSATVSRERGKICICVTRLSTYLYPRHIQQGVQYVAKGRVGRVVGSGTAGAV